MKYLIRSYVSLFSSLNTRSITKITNPNETTQNRITVSNTHFSSENHHVLSHQKWRVMMAKGTIPYVFLLIKEWDEAGVNKEARLGFSLAMQS